RVLTTLGPDWNLHVHLLKRKGALLDGPIILPSVPGALASVLTPRLMRPSQLHAKTEVSDVHALGRAVDRRRLRQLAAH
ncbi:MAG: recombinase RecA, partial [Rhodoferax sp.]